MKNIGFILLLIKLGVKIGPMLLKLIKTTKFVKGGLALGSLTAYSYMFTWQFAIILLFAIIVHEYGHLNAMKKCNIPTKGMYLIPFFGGAAVASETYKSFKKESYISIMGPVYGLFSIIPFYILYLLDPKPLWIGLISFIAMVNVFNLLPINPLDGGRIVKSIAFSLHSKLGYFIVIIGFIIGGYLVWLKGLYLLVFIMIIGLLEIVLEYKNINNNFFENMNKQEVFKYLFLYIGLISLFIYIIVLCGQVEGADLALKIIQDKNLE